MKIRSKVSRDRMFEILANGRKSANMVTITTMTEPAVIKGCPFPSLRKISRFQGTINFHYAAAVNRQREREGLTADFVPTPPAWGTPGPRPCLIEHKGKKYLYVKVNRPLETTYVSGGQVIPAEAVKPYLRQGCEDTSQGVSKPVYVRKYNLDSVLEISMDGKIYSLA